MASETDDGFAEWHLEGCCDREELIFIGLYFLYGILIHCLYHRTEFFYPFKLLAVFVHESSHASATWLTCGKVHGIEVYANEGGVAKFSGGNRYIITPAGYVGGAFWGGAFVALSGHRIGSTVAACIVSAALLIALAYVQPVRWLCARGRVLNSLVVSSADSSTPQVTILIRPLSIFPLAFPSSPLALFSLTGF
jgi:Peptidase M50B-like